MAVILSRELADRVYWTLGVASRSGETKSLRSGALLVAAIQLEFDRAFRAGVAAERATRAAGGGAFGYTTGGSGSGGGGGAGCGCTPNHPHPVTGVVPREGGGGELRIYPMRFRGITAVSHRSVRIRAK